MIYSQNNLNPSNHEKDSTIHVFQLLDFVACVFAKHGIVGFWAHQLSIGTFRN